MAVGFPAKTTWAAGDVLTSAGVDDLAGTLNLLQKLYTGLYPTLSLEEKLNIVAGSMTGAMNIDAITSAVWYYTSNAAANFTLNFRGDGTNTLNSVLAVGQSLTMMILNTNGATPYYPTAITIDGSAQTPVWSGGTAPAAGNANAIDAYTYTIIKTAATPTYKVLAGAVKFA